MAIRTFVLCATAIAAFAACSAPASEKPAAFDPAKARKRRDAYDARIIRDKFGVPHIYGKRNADVVFGLAYAHAEDDWKNIEEVVRSNRGTLAEIVGEPGAKSDDFILSLGNTDDREPRLRREGLARRQGDRRRLRRRPQPLVRRTCRHGLRPHRARARAGHHRRLRQPPALLLWPRWRDRRAALRPRQLSRCRRAKPCSTSATTSNSAPTNSPSRPRARPTATHASRSTRTSPMRAASPGTRRG